MQVQLPRELPYSRHRGVGGSQTQGTRLPWRHREHARDDTAVLSPLFCEKDLALPGRVGCQDKVHKSLVEASCAASAAAEGYLAGLGVTSQKYRERVPEKEPLPAQPGQALPHRAAVVCAVLWCPWLVASAGTDFGPPPDRTEASGRRAEFGFLPEAADRYCAGVRWHGCSQPLQHGDGFQVHRGAECAKFSGRPREGSVSLRKLR